MIRASSGHILDFWKLQLTDDASAVSTIEFRVEGFPIQDLAI